MDAKDGDNILPAHHSAFRRPSGRLLFWELPMSRIRSIHPEQWVDPQFVTCSPLARLVAIGIRNFADDNGVFEFNPVKLRMQVLPADNCDMAALLDELLDTNQITRFEVDGHAYGIIRSFTVFQRPKKPTFKYPAPSGLVGCELHTAYRPPVPHQLPTSGEDHPHRREGKGREELIQDDASAVPDPKKMFFDEGVKTLTAKGVTEKAARSQLGQLMAALKDDAPEALSLIKQASAMVDPRSWIASVIKERKNGSGKSNRKPAAYEAEAADLERLRRNLDRRGDGVAVGVDGESVHPSPVEIEGVRAD